MEIKTAPIFKQLLQAETLDADKKQGILSMIRCKNTESLPQAGNDKTTSLHGNTCKERLDGLYSRDTVSKKPHQHGRGKITHHNQ